MDINARLVGELPFKPKLRRTKDHRSHSTFSAGPVDGWPVHAETSS